MTTKFTAKNRSSRKRIVFLAYLVLLSGLLNLVTAGLLTKVVSAACPHEIQINYSSDSSPDRICNQENITKSGLTPEKFIDLRNGCQGVDSARGTGGPYGAGNIVVVPFSSEAGNCSNAIASCYQHVQVQSNCEDPLLLAWIAECNEGDVGAPATAGGASTYGLGGMSDGCGTEGAMKNLNEAFGKKFKTNNDIQKERLKSYSDKICTSDNLKKELSKDTVTEGDIIKCRTDLEYQVTACASKVSSQNGGTSLDDRVNLSDEQLSDRNNACMQKYATSQSACDIRGGIWMKDPDGPNTLDAGCYHQASDLTNPQACAAGAKATGKDLQWKQTGGADTSDTKDDVWGCVDPTAKPDDPTKDPDAECLKDGNGKCIGNGTFDKVNGECGEAKTNIISCGTDKGATALSNVLRIFVMVLSFGVGIAALGGLAYSAVQYAGASDSEGNVSAARERIRNIVIGLVLYGFLIAIANWLVPGGIF